MLILIQFISKNWPHRKDALVVIYSLDVCEKYEKLNNYCSNGCFITARLTRTKK